MTAAFLQTELTSLISDSKRKQNDVRSAAEKSLADLKSISVTSETQLAGDLLRNQYFIDPFILACNSKYVKLAATGTICLQRLVASRAIPRGRLSDLLEAFQEASHQGLDVQLKILQALPSLLQLYLSDLYGDDLAKVLSLCASLAASKTGMVSSTATATFQQLTTSVLEREEQRSSTDQSQDRSIVNEDASNIFCDMCMVISNQAPQFLEFSGISQALSLEVIENCLLNDQVKILQSADCLSACQTFLLPGMVEILEKSNNFHIFARCLRIVNQLLVEELTTLHTQLSEALHTVLDWLDGGSAANWKRVLCLELMRDVTSNFSLLVRLYTDFDTQIDQHNFLQDTLASLVRIAAEDPSLIGLGRQSTVPTDSNIDASNTQTSPIDVQIIDAIGSVLQASSNVTGISTRWSTVNTSLLEQMDRKTPPEVPETYVYTLVLACVAAVSDGLSKFIMPLSMPPRAAVKSAATDDTDGVVEGSDRKPGPRGQKHQQLLNPLKLVDGEDAQLVLICADLVEKCWPAILAICSTFLNSALDSTYYHTLVRTVQKLTQVSGVLELHTPRDALLTTLAKVSVPLNASSLVSMLHGNKPAKMTIFDVDDADDGPGVKSPTTGMPQHGVDPLRQNLNVRNLLCLRALLNLGIALGSSLEEASWFIIMQALQQVDALMSVSPTAKSATIGANPQQQAPNDDGQSNLAAEISAVGTASKRMFESTRTYSDSCFTSMINALFKMIDNLMRTTSNNNSQNGTAKQSAPFPNLVRSHTSSRSMSGAFASSTVLKIEASFVLKTANELARSNLYRFAAPRSKSCSWDLIVDKLLRIMAKAEIDSDLRLQAANIVDVVAMDTIRTLQRQKATPEFVDGLQQMCLLVLSKQIDCLYKSRLEQPTVVVTDVEIHRRVLEALENILSHTGDSLVSGWRIVFEILQTTIQPATKESKEDHDASDEIRNEALLRTVLPAFRTVQMIVSDFLESIDSESLWVLVQLLPMFGAQEHDVNISLTTASLFWNLNRLILQRAALIDVPRSLSTELSLDNDSGSPIATEQSSLWFATMIHLAELCGDRRSDVRNGALRVLLKIFDASGDQLTPAMWNLSIVKVLLPLLRQYTSMREDLSEWRSSYAHLLTGTVSLIGTHVEVIAKAQSMELTWQGLISIFECMLRQQTLAGHQSVFSSIVELLHSIMVLAPCPAILISEILRLWVEYHPADLAEGDVSYLAVFTTHAQILAEMDKCEKMSLTNSNFARTGLSDYVMKSTTRTLLASKQDKYTNDVKRMSSEQERVFANLKILQRIMLNEKHEYFCYLLGLIKAGLIRHETMEPSSKSETFYSKTSRSPKLTAFMLQLIELLPGELPQQVENNQWLVDLAVPEAFAILNMVMATKYSDFPDNDAAPIWKAATTTVAEIAQALKRNMSTLSSTDLLTLSQLIPSTIKAVLNASGLEKVSTPQEKILQDEAFDIDSFSRLHAAFDSLMRLPDFPESACKQYTLVLFGSSLVAKPWFGDFPPDLLHAPLKGLMEVRTGSIRQPDVLPRRLISLTALDALYASVKMEVDSLATPEGSLESPVTRPAKCATPYLILRITHAIKTFLADQSIRNLNPPPKALQQELNIILTKAITLRCQDAAFLDLPDFDLKNTRIRADGKTHLRVLYSLVLRLQMFWARLPRVKVCVWQDSEEGRAIQTAMQEWSRLLAEDWMLTAHGGGSCHGRLLQFP